MTTALLFILLGLGLAFVGLAVLIGRDAVTKVLAAVGLGLGAVVALIELLTT